MLTLPLKVNTLMPWFNKWGIKINETCKSSHITFSLRPQDCPPIKMNNSTIPHCAQVKYFGLTLDRRLTRSSQLMDKRKKLNSRLHVLLRPLLRSNINILNKIIIYTNVSSVPSGHMTSYSGGPSQKIQYSNDSSFSINLSPYHYQSSLVRKEQITSRWPSNQNHPRHSHQFLQKVSWETPYEPQSPHLSIGLKNSSWQPQKTYQTQHLLNL